MSPEKEDKLTPPTMMQIKKSSNKDELRSWRQYLMSNVKRLVEEKYIEWKIWEEMICRIDNMIDNTPVMTLIPPRQGETKGIRV